VAGEQSNGCYGLVGGRGRSVPLHSPVEGGYGGHSVPLHPTLEVGIGVTQCPCTPPWRWVSGLLSASGSLVARPFAVGACFVGSGLVGGGLFQGRLRLGGDLRLRLAGAFVRFSLGALQAAK
jgi:hypothetical protein